MGIFSNSSPFDDVVIKATLETNTKEDWGQILDICDKVTISPTAPKECLRSIVRRLNNPDPHVVVQAVTLLDACVSNCGLPFHLEVASREFEQEFGKLLQKITEKSLRDKLLHCLQKWAENEFKSDPQLDLIPSLYNKLRRAGIDFSSDNSSSSSQKPRKSSSHHHHHHKSRGESASSSTAPVAQEDADLAKAIELSLKEAKQGSSSQSKSLYPQTSSLSGTSNSNDEKEPTKVRALYDFEAAEENELTFYAGEIVFVTDDTDTNWWQGSNQRGKGLFPANFVTTDLSVEPTKLDAANKKSVQFSEDVEVQSINTEPEIVEIDEGKIDKVLHMLHEADPTGEVEDPLELAGLEDQVNQMGPLIDQELEKIDRKHAQLTRLGGELVEALNIYHNLMREPIGMGQPPMSYGMKMGTSAPPMPMPQFTSMQGSPMHHPGYSYDPNMQYQQMAQPLPNSSNGAGGYNSMQYQQPSQNVSMGQQQPNNGQQVMTNSMSIPNGQIGPQTSQPNIPQQMTNQMNPNMIPGQIPYYSQPMMMVPHGQNVQYDMSQQQQQQTMGVPPPHMSMPSSQTGPQQFTPTSSQAYPQSPPHNAPAV